jgi:hypothetical protein
MPPSSHEKPLSPHEETILAAVEEELRVDDPNLSAARSPTPPSSPTTHPLRLPIRHVRSRAEATSGAHAAKIARRPADSGWSALPTGIQYGTPLLAVVLLLVAQPLVPPLWRGVLGVVLWLVVLPVVFLWFFGRRG